MLIKKGNKIKNLKKTTLITLALIAYSPFVSSSTPQLSPQQALLQAINQNNLPDLQAALKKGVNVNMANHSGVTPLMTASLITLPTLSPLIPYLVSHGASLTAKDHNGCTPLDYALLGFTPGTATFLKSKGAPVGTNALVNAINQNNIAAVEKLLKEGANPNLFVGFAPILSLLTCSTAAESVSLAEVLLKGGANINARDIDNNTPLMNAVQENNTAMVSLFFRYNAQLDLKENHGGTALMMSITPHDTTMLQLLIAAHTNVNLQDNNGCTALMQAVNSGNLPAVQALLAAGAKTTPQADKSHYFTTALLLAVTSKTVSLPIVHALLNAPDAQASINLQDSYGWTAVMYAVNTKNLPLTQLLISAGAKTTPQANKANALDTALLIAVTNQTVSLPIVQALLQAPDSKDSINLQDTTGWTALMYAVSNNNLPLTQLLLASRAKTTPQANQANASQTALIVAISQSASLSVVQALLNAPDSKQSVNLQDNTGTTALMYAATAGNLPATQALLAAGADTTIATPNGQTALSVAAANCKSVIETASYEETNTNLLNGIVNNNLAAVKTSLAAGANPNWIIEGKQLGTTRLSLVILATQHGYTPIAQMLINAKANVNFQDNYGATALIYAAQAGNLKLANALLKAGANPNLQTNAANSSTTALIVATQAGNQALVKALATTKGINANIQDYIGMTALMYAAQNSSLPLLQLLVEIPGINLNLVNNNLNAPQASSGYAALDYTYSTTGAPTNCTTFLSQKGALAQMF